MNFHLCFQGLINILKIEIFNFLGWCEWIEAGLNEKTVVDARLCPCIHYVLRSLGRACDSQLYVNF